MPKAGESPGIVPSAHQSGIVDKCQKAATDVCPSASQSNNRTPMLSLRTASNRWSDERVQDLHDYLSRTGSAAYEVVVDGASHNSFSDLPMIDFAHYSSDIDPARAADIVAAVTRAFLAACLMDDQNSAFITGQWPFPEIHVRTFVRQR